MITNSFASRHFFAKFDNTGSGKEADVVSLLTEENDVMIVTKKHSGSLILIHSIYKSGQWHLVVNSKNGKIFCHFRIMYCIVLICCPHHRNK